VIFLHLLGAILGAWCVLASFSESYHHMRAPLLISGVVVLVWVFSP
jgi:hypothetical protein